MHEAVAIDPATDVIYETEDANGSHGGFYRWTPPAGFTGGKGALHALAGKDAAGALEAMSCARGSKSPYGGVILAEDGRGIQHLVGVTAQGKSYPMARNELASRNEFTGSNFSADGKILFANIQSPGHVFAITGPWGRPSNARS